MIKAIKTIVGNVLNKITGKAAEKAAASSYTAKRDTYGVPDLIK